MSDSQGTGFALEVSREDLTPHAVGVGTFLLAYGLLLRGIELGRLYAFGDFVPYYGARAFGKFLGTWHEGGLGFPYVYNVMPAYLGTVTALGGALGQNLFYLALVPAGFATFYVFAGRFLDEPVPRYLAAGVYAINPLTIGEFVNGGVSTLIGFVGFPLIVHYLYRIDEEDAWRPAVLVGVVFGATAIVPWLVFWMIGPFAAYFAYRSRRDPRKFAKFVAGGALGVVLSLPNVHHILQRAAGFGDGDGVLWTTLRWNYEQADPLAVVRLAGNHGMLAMNELGYNTDPTMVIGLAVPAVALFAVGRERLRLYYAIAVGCVVFVVLTGLGLTDPLFETVPLFWSVRNPAKLQYPLLLSLSLLFGAGLETVLHGRTMPGFDVQSYRSRAEDARDPLLRGLLVGLVVLSLVAYAAPAAGAFGLEGVRGDDYAVPEEYGAVAEELDGRALWVPYGYTTQLRLRDTQPNHVGIKSGGVVQGIPNVDYVTRLFEDVAAGESVHGRLRDLGVEYVVVESDPPGAYGAGAPRVQSKWGAPWLFGDPATLNERFAGSEAYERAFATGDLTVYRVTGVPDRERVVEQEGLHAVVYPEETDTAAVGDNVLANPSFDDGTAGWWTPPNESGRETRLVDADGDAGVELSVSGDTQPLPVAQAAGVRDGYPYRVAVDAAGEGVATLYWYEGEKSPDTLVSREVVPVSAFPRTVTARGDTLSIRIKPNASSEVVVREATVARASYPAATAFAGASAGVPGVVVDGRDDPPTVATVVAVNLDRAAAADAGADVRIADAETTLSGDLVLDDDYRQGAGVLLPDGERPAAVPEDARLVTHDTANGTVLDYWVEGSFDATPVTTVRTSYAAGWSGSADAEHFRAQGWANGFTDTTPDEVSWTGGGLRGVVVRVWLAAWALTLAGLVVPPVATRLRERFGGSGPTDLP
ncbi:hypothetical protein ACFQL9_17285 [Halobaculum lipolyticum]|uniref:Membrane protein 6-pyruvoyl-tetrahydropterin synthase-related domain-containing protein n=1 Tax=Halobaculum lipolyticum TaxID=3032001 RepID=A0ABD5WJ41_9EURY